MRRHWPLISLLATSLLTAAATVVGCGGTDMPSDTATPDFALDVSPAMASVTGGAAGQSVSVMANAVNGFATPVVVALSGLPAGVTAKPATLTLSAGVAQNIVLTADATVASGSATVTLTGTSGMLSHSAALALTTTAAPPPPPPPPPPDFSLMVTPKSQTLVEGTTGTALSVQATATNGFASPVTVNISGLPAGVTAKPASLTLPPGAAQNVTLTASIGAATGAATVTFTGTAGALSHTATLALNVQTPPVPDVTTYHFDNARDGLNAQETVLTPANVTSATFGKIGFFPADGKVDAQPLYLAGFDVNGTATNVLYMATEHGSMYAFNADTGAQIWTVSLLGSSETTSDPRGCGQIIPEIGITSTPVIDRAKGVIFAVAMSKDASGRISPAAACAESDKRSGTAGQSGRDHRELSGNGRGSSGGNVPFDPAQYAERAGLLLLNGTVYLAWTSHCDIGAYTGWVMAYSEKHAAADCDPERDAERQRRGDLDGRQRAGRGCQRKHLFPRCERHA